MGPENPPSLDTPPPTEEAQPVSAPELIEGWQYGGQTDSGLHIVRRENETRMVGNDSLEALKEPPATTAPAEAMLTPPAVPAPMSEPAPAPEPQSDAIVDPSVVSLTPEAVAVPAPPVETAPEIILPAPEPAPQEATSTTTIAPEQPQAQEQKESDSTPEPSMAEKLREKIAQKEQTVSNLEDKLVSASNRAKEAIDAGKFDEAQKFVKGSGRYQKNIKALTDELKDLAAGEDLLKPERVLELKDRLDRKVAREEDRLRQADIKVPIDEYAKMAREILVTHYLQTNNQEVRRRKILPEVVEEIERMLDLDRPQLEALARDSHPILASEELKMAISMLDGDEEPEEEPQKKKSRRHYLQGIKVAARYINDAIGFDFKPSEHKTRKLLESIGGELTKRRKATLAWIAGSIAMSGSAYQGKDFKYEQRRSAAAAAAERAQAEAEDRVER